MLHTIPMVDLQAQYRRFKGEIDLAILNVLDEGIFIQGNIVREFENQLAATLNVKHVITCANGTDALQIAFMALDLPKGSEVIIPTYTYAALAEILHLLGLIPVFVDVMKDGFLMDVSQIASKITSKTKAIAPVHLFGECADLFEIIKIAKQHSLFVIEDTAQAIGSVFCAEGLSGFAGTLGDIGTTSFFPSKNLGCYGDGGAIFTNNDHLANKMRMIANHGQSQKYIHEIIGINSRLDTIQAAILMVKLNHLKSFTSNRQLLAQRYIDALGRMDGVFVPQKNEFSTHVYHQFSILMIDKAMRDSLKLHLEKNGVSSMVYYLLPLHKQLAYKTNDSLPLSEAICNSVLSLPICPELTIENQDRIINLIIEFTQNYKNN
jgi:UDP-2-acetamido-2-deoxy-ribo-hexuluronate aminotransferase